MPFPLSPDHMYSLRGQTVKQFGYDQESQVDYAFNSLGYRSPVEFVDHGSPIVLLGNTISFGLGLPVEQSFAGIIAQELDCDVYNFAWGCHAHTNAEQLVLLKQILQVIKPQQVIFQINNLDRIRRNNHVQFNNPNDIVISEFVKFRQELEQALESIPHLLLYWDENQYSVPLPRCLIHNRYHCDTSLKSNATTFGPRSHKLIAYSILKEIK